MYDEIIKYVKKQLAQSKKISANQQATIKHILDSNRQMIENNRR